MSYAMTHLAVAREYLKLHPYVEEDCFYLGNIAPDSVHALADYVPAYKEKSHFLPGDIRWGSVHTTPEMERLYANIKGIDKVNRLKFSEALKDTKTRAFYDGYILHLIVDVFNIQKIYGPHFNAAGLEIWDFMKDYRAQCIIQDNWLYRIFPDSEGLLERLEGLAGSKEFEEILSKLEFDKVINVSITEKQIAYYRGEYRKALPIDISESTMHTEENTREFIRYTADMADKVLFDFPVISGMFDM